LNQLRQRAAQPLKLLGRVQRRSLLALRGECWIGVNGILLGQVSGDLSGVG